MKIFHQQQRDIWEKEHKNPSLFVGLASEEVSGGVEDFWRYLKPFCKKKDVSGLEIGCGKGRNVLWLAKRGVNMTGFDFSASAIKTAKQRTTSDVKKRVRFLEHDFVQRWPFPDKSFDFVVDCFTLIDACGARDLNFSVKELFRVLKPGGYFFLYTNSTGSTVYKEKGFSKTKGKNEYLYPVIGKFERVFSQKELDSIFKKFELKKSKVFKRYSLVGKKQFCWEHIWRVYRKKIHE